ncbi:MAG TPA: hypothetical protein VKZ50_04500 [bacterium]|nr:hypothetical protein [bacterium]
MDIKDVKAMSPNEYRAYKAQFLADSERENRRASVMLSKPGGIVKSRHQRKQGDATRVEAEKTAALLAAGTPPEHFSLNDMDRAARAVLKGALLAELRKTGRY